MTTFADIETTLDLFNNRSIATTIVALLEDRPGTPITIGVHGDWGAGKSSVLEMIADELSRDDETLCIKFNGWQFQGFEDAKIAMIEGIVNELIRSTSLMEHAKEQVSEVLKRINWLKVAKHAGGLAFTAMTGIPTGQQIEGVIDLVRGLGKKGLPDDSTEVVEQTIEQIQGYLKPESQGRSVPKEITEFRESFSKLLEKSKRKRIVVLIDDLDRCLPDVAIETLEAIRLFLSTPRTAFIIGADEAMIEFAVRRHFPMLPDSSGPQSYARDYLEKLIQVPFRIPSLGPTETLHYVALLLIGDALGENSDEFKQLITVANQSLSKPWEASKLDFTTIKNSLGDQADNLKEALLLSEQIGPILAKGTKGNPRQIKRFLNALFLRLAIAESRGFGADVRKDALAKLMLAEHFLPTCFERIALSATSTSEGRCTELKPSDKQPVKATKKKKTTVKTASTEDEVTTSNSAPAGSSVDWLRSPEVQEWLQLSPALYDIDLRPYLFVTRDRTPVFGLPTAMGHLAGVIQDLMGSRLAVQRYATRVSQLTSPEASQVASALKSRIVSAGNLKDSPDGIDGLSLVVKSHPHLQSDLIDLLESLPIQNLGPWATSGWSGVITSPTEIARLEAILTKWETQEQNKLLKTTANAALTSLKRGS